MTSSIPNVDAIGCPFLRQLQGGKTTSAAPLLERTGFRALEAHSSAGHGGVPDGGYDAVKQDIIDMVLTNSKDFFPADFGNYGGLMIRLAWHCAGSYRESDGRGGCDGGRIRFAPERDWPDNGNLNHALDLLKPVKEKYGSKLSWGDLIILSGNAAIESMGGPVMGFCGGRIDDADGSDSLHLGPSDEQEAIAPCLTISRDGHEGLQGECNMVPGSPIGPTTVGLIYVNPAGPKGHVGDPVASAEDIRRAFANMGFSDRETVSLVGGGHAFGKCHGACMDPPCGKGTDMEGIGNNTFTSGFEGPWTTQPTTWTNEYFQNMFGFEWTLITGPGGNPQWEPSTGSNDTMAPDIMMLTSDLALVEDEAYKVLSEEYASDISSLETDFMNSWYRLTTADMGPVSRCIGDNIPPAKEFQSPLPDAPTSKPDYVPVRAKIQQLIEDDQSNSAAFVNLAYQCASTYRATDYKGGCNGARIRFSPESDWDENSGSTATLTTLDAVKADFPDVSMADIIVLAGQTAIEDSGMKKMNFCGGRVDADNANGSEILAPRHYEPAVVSIRDDMQVKGLTAKQGVALAGRHALSNQFYKDLLAGDGDFADYELALLEMEFKVIVEEFASDEDSFKNEFASAWNYMMTADRFDGPFDNACDGVNDATMMGVDDTTTSDDSAASSMTTWLAAGAEMALAMMIIAVAAW